MSTPSTPAFQAAPKPTCAICGHQAFYLGGHLAKKHSLTLEQYWAEYPEQPVVAPEVVRRVESTRIKRQPPPPLEEMKFEFSGLKLPINWQVPLEACLPLPEAYRIPEHGLAAKDAHEAAIALHRRRSLYIWGLSGTGKDAFVHAYSHHTRTPARIFQIQPGSDIEPWLFTRGFNAEETYFEEGELLKAARDGYVCSDGSRIPYLILITDFDRASRSQAEILRLITDSIEGRIPGPAGKVYSVLPGTTIVATANTAGGGDETGRYVSTNVIDSSLMGRFNRKIKFRFIDWKDEVEVVQAKFPLFVDKMGAGMLTTVGKVTTALRKAIEEGQLYAEFSHRDLCSWVGHAEDILAVTEGSAIPPDLMQRASRMFLSGLPDAQTRLQAKRLMDPHIKGGILPRGDTSGMHEDEDVWG